MKTILSTLIIASTFAAGAAFAEPAVGPDNAWLKAQEVSTPAPSAAAAEHVHGSHLHVEDAAPGQSFSPNP